MLKKIFKALFTPSFEPEIKMSIKISVPKPVFQEPVLEIKDGFNESLAEIAKNIKK